MNQQLPPPPVTARQGDVAAAPGSDLYLHADGEADLHDPAVRTAAEEFLQRLPGVDAARIVPGDRRAVEQVHVLATTEASPKMIVRDVETVLSTRFGILIDRRVVSVAQLDLTTFSADQAETAASAAPTRRGRPILDGVTVDTRRDSTSVTVELHTTDGQTLTGTTAARQGAMRAGLAVATLRSVAPLLEPNRVRLEQVTTASIGELEAIVVSVELDTGRGTNVLLGTAPLRDGIPNATVRATLDAVNRLIELAPVS